MPFPNIDPVAFAIGPLVVRWYALAYLGGVLFGMLYGMSLLRRHTLWKNNTPPFPPPALSDFAFWAIIGIVLGGRIGYVLFYNPLYFAQHPIEIFEVWTGGMSFHGGLIGIVTAMVIFARRHGGNPVSGVDLLAAVTPIGLFLGRLANFINGELYGRPTTLPWGIVFPTGGPLPRHPSQLYEAALEGVVLFLVLRYVTHIAYGLRRPGLVSGVFAIGYAVSRILVEFVRLPDVQIGYLYGGWLTIGMVYSLPLLLAGIVLILYANRTQRA